MRGDLACAADLLGSRQDGLGKGRDDSAQEESCDQGMECADISSKTSLGLGWVVADASEQLASVASRDYKVIVYSDVVLISFSVHHLEPRAETVSGVVVECLESRLCDLKPEQSLSFANADSTRGAWARLLISFDAGYARR